MDPEGNDLVLIECAGSWDAGGISVGRASILVERLWDDRVRILAHGPPEQVDLHPAARGAARVDRLGMVLLPGLVNAHTHLDLTHLGPRAWDPSSSFDDWLAIIRAGRLTEAGKIEASVGAGAALARAGGTVAIGDIAGAFAGSPRAYAAAALSRDGMAGVSFLEFFAIGPRSRESMRAVECVLEGLPAHAGEFRLGLQPHAPYSVEAACFGEAVRLAAARGMPLATHLAESPDEREFIGRGTGPQRRLLEQFDAWEDALLESIGLGAHPVEHLRPALEAARRAGLPFLAAHVNDADDAALETLRRNGASVAYCPRASAYFGADRHFGPHRYREMLSGGINVCLGTDSVVNITDGTVEAGTGGRPPGGRLSVLDEMRLLHRRDGVDPVVLVRMATVNGALALGLDPDRFRLREGCRPLGIIGVPVPTGAVGAEAVREALRSTDGPVFVLARTVAV